MTTDADVRSNEIAGLSAMGLMSTDPGATPHQLEEVKLTYHLESHEIGISWRCEANNTIPMAQWLGVEATWKLSPNQNAGQFVDSINAGELDELLKKLLEKSSLEGDGNKCVQKGLLFDAHRDIEEWLRAKAIELELPSPAGVWEADDWFQEDTFELTAEVTGRTHDELKKIAKKYDDEAAADYVLIDDCLGYLEGLRDQSQD